MEDRKYIKLLYNISLTISLSYGYPDPIPASCQGQSQRNIPYGALSWLVFRCVKCNVVGMHFRAVRSLFGRDVARNILSPAV